MRTVRDVLGPDCRKPKIVLNWAGRNESALQVARRISETLSVISGRYLSEPVRWYRYLEEMGAEPVPVPEELKALAEVVEASYDHTLGEYFARSSISLFLFEDPGQRSSPVPAVNVAAGSGNSNLVTVDLPEELPTNSPSEAARLFLDVARIWQPDTAEFTTADARVSAMTAGQDSHAAYLSWWSAKAYGAAPASEREIVVRVGDGWLYAAREWSLPAVLALGEELTSLGSQKAMSRPEKQDPPSLPDGYPVELYGLDDQITWGTAE